MFVVVLFLGDDTRIHGTFESYDDANDYVVMEMPKDLLNVEIIEVEKVASEVV